MKLSVILPVYNAEKYLAKSIQSIINQTYKEFEFIIINDGSKDSSLEIIKSFNDSRIVLIDQENKGLAKTLNIGLIKAKGDYIARMDADDIALPNRLEVQMNYLFNNPDVALLGTAIELIDENDKHLSYHAPYIGHNKLVDLMQNQGNPFKHPSVIFKKSLALELGGFNEMIGKYFEDYFLWNLIASKAKVDNLPHVLLKYRITPGSIMSSFKNQKLDQLVLNTIRKKEFFVEDKQQMDRLIDEIKIQNTNIKRGKQSIKFKLLNRIIDGLYLIIGNKIIKYISVIKSK